MLEVDSLSSISMNFSFFMCFTCIKWPNIGRILLLFWLFYELSQLLQSKKNTRFDRRYRTSRNACDLVIAELFVDSHFENRFLLRRQKLNHAAKMTAFLFLFK